MKYKLLAAIAFVFFLMLQGQSQGIVLMPGNTGYASPVEEEYQSKQGILFNDSLGLSNWGKPHSPEISYYFYAANKGVLSISARVRHSGINFSVSISGKPLIIHLPSHTAFHQVPLMTLRIDSAGFYSLHFRTKGSVNSFLDLKSLVFSGPAAAGLKFNSKPRRNAASVHLRYPFPDSLKLTAFYNELRVPAGADPLHSYFMACGFKRGYLGMQVNSEQERRIIFSVWDAGRQADNRDQVATEDQVELLAKGQGVVAEVFGGEGTGGHSHWVYPWKSDSVYRFLVTALPDSSSRSTIYTGYFFNPGKKLWKLLASFRAPRDGENLHGLYSFVENFEGENGQLFRAVYLGPQYVREDAGPWKALTEATFSYDATGKAGDRLDYGASVKDSLFFLWNGGFRKPQAQWGQSFYRQASHSQPDLLSFRNADSTEQWKLDQQEILGAIKSGKYDTSGSYQGIYYKIIAEGSGRNALVSDTVSVHYKGTLLNGEVFDQTKEIPAVFPLSRLIKGWQLGLPLLKKGGKIRIIIPSALAYSIRARSAQIKPNSILVFEIELLDLKPSAVANP